jgi:hypothetical protein
MRGNGERDVVDLCGEGRQVRRVAEEKMVMGLAQMWCFLFAGFLLQ